MSTSKKATDNYSGYFHSLCETCRQNSVIDPLYYQNFNVKRGLRNADGTGVMAGVTLIGNVHGYVVNEGDVVPVPGELVYRGVNVKDIVDAALYEDRFAFEEVIFLILFGKLPTKTELETLQKYLEHLRDLPARFTEDVLMSVPSPNIMNKMQQAILALYSYDSNPDDNSLENLMRQSLQLIAQFPTIITRAYQVKKYHYDRESLNLHYYKEGLSVAESFLYTMRPDQKYTALEAKILDLALVLHSEHGGGNNSAFACRVLSSACTDTYSAISAAIGSLKGEKHGGANHKVRQMFEIAKAEIDDWNDEDKVLAFLGRILNRETGDKSGLIYGIGHAVYTQSDPRAEILRGFAKKLAAEKGQLDEFNLLYTIERLAPKAFEVFRGQKRTICANVDLYTGLIYDMLGLPKELYTPLFAMGRIVGWTAHRIEEVLTGGRIIRPAYKSISKERQYIPLDER